MSDSDKIQIVNIVINVIMTIGGWAVLIWATKKTIQATLQAAKPVPKAKPTRPKVLSPFQKRFVIILRAAQALLLSEFPIAAANLYIAYCCIVREMQTYVYVFMILINLCLCVIATVRAQALIVRIKAADPKALEIIGVPKQPGRPTH